MRTELDNQSDRYSWTSESGWMDGWIVGWLEVVVVVAMDERMGGWKQT